MTVSTKDILSADHEELGRLLDRAFMSLERADGPNALASIDLFWARLAMHIRAEHLHLFPVLLRSNYSTENEQKDDNSSPNSVTNIIEQLRSDHNWFMNELASLIKQMRLFVFSERSDAIAAIDRLETFRERLTIHDEIEEAEVYPLVEQILEPAEVLALNMRIKKELEKFPLRFADRGNLDI